MSPGMGYVLIGAVVATMMAVGMKLSAKRETPSEVFGVTSAALVVSVVLWMVLATVLDLPESASATTRISILMMVLGVASVMRHKRQHE